MYEYWIALLLSLLFFFTLYFVQLAVVQTEGKKTILFFIQALLSGTALFYLLLLIWKG